MTEKWKEKDKHSLKNSPGLYRNEAFADVVDSEFFRLVVSVVLDRRVWVVVGR